MSDRFTPRSIGGGMVARLGQMLAQQEAARRQAGLDGIAAEDRMAARARLENEARRQAVEQQHADADRVAKIAGPNADLSPEQADALRQGGYQIDQRTTLPARTMTPGVIAPGSWNDLGTQTYNRRAETYGEQVARQQVERQQREATDKEATRVRERNEGFQRRDAKDTTNAQQHAEDVARGEAHFNASRADARYAVDHRADASGDKTTEGQRRTAGLLQRAQAARSTVDKLEGEVSTLDLLSPSFLRTAKGQQYRQGAKQWIQSVLRDESGAAIGADEEASYFETYFRQPGDYPTVIRQKQEARDAAEHAMAQKVGGNQHQGGGGSNVRRYNPATGQVE